MHVTVPLMSTTFSWVQVFGSAGASTSGMQAAGAETSGDELNHHCIIGLYPSLQKCCCKLAFDIAADVALQQVDDKRPASTSNRACSRGKSVPKRRELPSADKKSEAAAKGRKIRPQPGQGTQVIYKCQLTLQLAHKLMMCRQHTLCMSVSYPDDPVKISQQMQTFLAILLLA